MISHRKAKRIFRRSSFSGFKNHVMTSMFAKTHWFGSLLGCCHQVSKFKVQWYTSQNCLNHICQPTSCVHITGMSHGVFQENGSKHWFLILLLWCWSHKRCLASTLRIACFFVRGCPFNAWSLSFVRSISATNWTASTLQRFGRDSRSTVIVDISPWCLRGNVRWRDVSVSRCFLDLNTYRCKKAVE